ncbi:MAG: HAD family hydrolase [Clostridia bacterium]
MKACIFDLDGTLANTLPTLIYIGNRALSACGFRTVSPDVYPQLIGNGANRLISGLIQCATGVPPFPGELSRVRAEYDRIYAENPLYLTVAYDGITSLLDALTAHGIALAVLSNKPHDMTCRVISGLFGDGIFSVCFGQRDGVPRKPAPDGALAIAHSLGVSPADILYIGDSGVDMCTGNAAGMVTAGVLWGFRPESELRLHDAAHIVTAPCELLPLAVF